ncbi:anti-lipopolysaccharide factor-like [Eriocheir sinensis]|uniref:ALF-L n=1 Tax=Eriocheir sinensis TaxID=95602 RepID=A0AAU7YU15_ERISI|nr:anti-lipopolysaccharide factor-like [Eriocheir sinensis]
MARGYVSLLVAVVVVAGVLHAPTPVQGFDFSAILSSVADTAINRLYVDREINIVDHYCTLNRSPHFYRWELKWRATVTCPGWTPIKGTARNYYSPNTAEREATRDFVRKAVDRGLIEKEDVTEWL